MLRCLAGLGKDPASFVPHANTSSIPPPTSLGTHASPQNKELESLKRENAKLEAKVASLERDKYGLEQRVEAYETALRITASAKRESAVIEEPQKAADG